jgi:16S rRNA G966 N2-methylase RsmD
VVRLTAGIWRGRKLAIPPGIRPTTELARKAAFDILGDAIRGARVLDACAGSGAYGLEALSRGAAHATFVEADRGVARTLRGNVERVGARERASVEVTTVARFSSKGEKGEKLMRAGSTARIEPTSAARSSSKGEERGTGGRQRRESFDVVFHDPPFEETSESSESDLMLLMPLVRAGGWLFHERGDEKVLHPSGLAPADRRRYGTTRFLIFRP